MEDPVTCYAVFSPDYEKGKIAVFSWLGTSEAEVRERMEKLEMTNPLYEVRPVATHKVGVGDIWRFPVGGPYKEIPWVKVIQVDDEKQCYGQTPVRVLLCADKEFVPATCYDLTLFEAYLMLYAEFVGST